jgi:hypothetical protein
VGWDSPEPGTELASGSQVELHWQVVIPHETTAHLLALQNDEGGRKILTLLDATDHSLTWQVPAVNCSGCTLLVVQINEGADYGSALPVDISAQGEPEIGFAPPEGGDVGWEMPAPGTFLIAGSEVELRWTDLIERSTTGYLVEFRTSPEAPPSIVEYLDADERGLLWLVPTVPCDDCALLVTQVNEDVDANATLPIIILTENDPPAAGPVEPAPVEPAPVETAPVEPAALTPESPDMDPNEPEATPAVQDDVSVAGAGPAPLASSHPSTMQATIPESADAMNGMSDADGVGCTMGARAFRPSMGWLALSILGLALARIRAFHRRKSVGSGALTPRTQS